MRIADKLRAAGLAIILSWGWKRAAIALAAGALSVLAMAPFNAWPVLFLTFPVMVWLIDGAGAGRWRGVPAAAMAGWWFGLGYFVPGLYWIGYAFLVDAPTFAWLMPFAVLGLPAYLALFTAFGFALARLIWTSGRFAGDRAGREPDDQRMAARSCAHGLSMECVRLRADRTAGAGADRVADRPVGPDISQRGDLRKPGGADRWKFTRTQTVGRACDGADAAARRMGIFGAVRLGLQPTATVANVKLRIMQPNLQQDVRFNYSAKAEVMQKYLTLSDRASGPQSTGVRDASILIWPESAFPFFLTREADAMAQIDDLLPKGTILITGSVRAPDLPPGTKITRAYNSIYAIDHDGSVLSIYDKLHLVPFGEYLPFQDRMEKLGFVQLTKVQGGFIAGTRRRTMEIPNAPRALPLICYEAIFPGDVAARDDRPGWIVNLTNDGWFGISTGPYQHLQQARLRAIEEGLPVVRAANTGISAVIDPLGRIVARLGLGVEGVLDSSLPSAIAPTDLRAQRRHSRRDHRRRRLDFRHSAARCEADFLTPADIRVCFEPVSEIAGQKSAVDRPTAPFAFCSDRSQFIAQIVCIPHRTFRARFDGMGA